MKRLILKILNLSIFLVFFLLFSQNIFYFLIKSLPQMKTVFSQPFASYDWKMEHEVGDFYLFMKFVNENTPRESLILHPTQQTRWSEISNENYSRYFLFPRDLVSEDERLEKKEKATFVFIIGRKSLDGKTRSDPWPQEVISAKRLIYFRKGEEPIVVKRDYQPDDPLNKYWGLIEIKK